MNTLSRPALAVSWICQLVAAVILGQTLYFKFTGAPESVYIFSTLHAEPWGRIGSGVLELVAFLEERFGITVQDQELVAANLDSVNGLVRFLERKLQAAEQRSDGGR